MLRKLNSHTFTLRLLGVVSFEKKLSYKTLLTGVGLLKEAPHLHCFRNTDVTQQKGLRMNEVYVTDSVNRLIRRISVA